MPRFKALIFDYGGVLEGPLDEDAFRTDLTVLATRYRFNEGRDLWHHLYVSTAWEQAKRGKISREEFWKDRLSALGIHTKEEGDEFIHLLHRNRGVRPEMQSLLRELHGACRLAVLSNTSRRNFARYLAERRGLDGLFDVVISSAEVGLAKPEPEIYLLTLARLQLSAPDVLFIDDLSRNTEAANRLGMASIAFVDPAQFRSAMKDHGMLE